MSADAHEDLARALELLADRSTQGLGRAEAETLGKLLAAFPDLDDTALDVAAAGVELALAGSGRDSLPGALRAAVLADTEAGCPPPSRAGAADDAEAGDRPVTPPAAPAAGTGAGAGWIPGARRPVSGAASRAAPAHVARVLLSRLRDWLRARSSAQVAWAVAAVLLVVALSGHRPEAAAPPAEARAELLASAGDSVEIPWTPGERIAGGEAGGDVVWSASRQRGFLRARGLPPNDPGKVQYQLWIADAARGRHPVDGGVFDVPPQAVELVVPIDPRLPVREPTRFEVTLEPSGGVVVSRRDPVILSADVADARR